MANKYVRAAGGNSNADTTWSTTSGGAADTTAPTAADDVFLDANSGQLTMNAAFACRSINCTGYTGTLTRTASNSLDIGDATAGASNIALKFVAGMTYVTASNAFTNFISTSATTQTIDGAGKEFGSTAINGAGSSYQLTGSFNVATVSTLTLTAGTLDTNGQTCSWGLFSSSNTNTRVVTLGASALTITGTGTTWNMATVTGLTLNAGTSTITFTGTGANPTLLASAAQVFYNLVFSGSGVVVLQGSIINCTNLTRTGTAAKTDALTITGNLTCTGTFTCNGNSSTNRILVQGNTLGTARTITAAIVSVTNSDFQDITGAGAGSWDLSAITGLSGDCGGNSGITFTTPATQTYTGGTGNWSDVAKWSSRIPLPQDNVSMSGVTGGSITSDMPRLGKDIDWTAAAGTPAWVMSSINTSIFGSVTMISGMTYSGNTGKTHTLSGRGNHTITSAGLGWRENLTIAAVGGTYTLQDALILNASSGTFTLNNGVFDSNNFNITASQYNCNSNVNRQLIMGSSVFTSTLSSLGNFWNFSSTNLTLSAQSATISLSNTSASVRTFIGASQTYGTLDYTVAGSTGGLDITGTNTFSEIRFSDASNARTLRFTAATTTTFTGAGIVGNGASGRLLVLDSITAATHTLTKSSGTVSLDWWNISDSIAQGGASWYAGANSTDGGNNSGWVFTAAPSQSVGANSAGLRARQGLQNLQSLQ